jgi:hypothetical protein
MHTPSGGPEVSWDTGRLLFPSCILGQDAAYYQQCVFPRSPVAAPYFSIIATSRGDNGTISVQVDNRARIAGVGYPSYGTHRVISI